MVFARYIEIQLPRSRATTSRRIFAVSHCFSFGFSTFLVSLVIMAWMHWKWPRRGGRRDVFAWNWYLESGVLGMGDGNGLTSLYYIHPRYNGVRRGR